MAKKKEEKTKNDVPSLMDFMTKSIKKDEDIIRLSDMKEREIVGCAVPSPAFRSLLAESNGIIPYGSQVQIIGWEAMGKSNMAWSVLAAELFKDERSVTHYNDVERAGFGYQLANNYNVDEKRCWVTQPSSGEEALGLTEKFLRNLKAYRDIPEIAAMKEKDKPHGVCVIDSVPALVPGILVEMSEEDKKKKVQKAALAALLSEKTALFRILVANAGAILVWVNQWRKAFDFKTSRSWNEPCGGNALKYYTDIKLSISKISTEKVADKEVGLKLRVTCLKNKVGESYKSTEILFGWGNGPYDLGIDTFYDLFMELKDKGYRIQPKGDSWSTLKVTEEALRFQGMTGFKKRLLADKHLLDKCVKACEFNEYEKMYREKYKLMLEKQEQIKAIEEKDIVHETDQDLGKTESGSKIKQIDDGGYSSDLDAADAMMKKDANDFEKLQNEGDA